MIPIAPSSHEYDSGGNYGEKEARDEDVHGYGDATVSRLAEDFV